ncbi:unnamed protein product [Brachionus calyciflorus]|uniref:PDZ domain-containing protein n=1 Tax=Brachionus calyciflorus TaxID=104777 RepID=A0A813YJX4_9BILA|nr:unnamed protein product [Brachionus calyciflorus]
MANFTAPMIPIILERHDPSVPWGFRLQGGADYRLHLSIKKVNPNSPAHNKLHPGDVIVGIQGADVSNFTHQQGSDLIKMSGGSLNLLVRKGQYNVIKPTRPPTKFTQTGQTILPVQNAYRRF